MERELLDAIRSAEACLRIFDARGKYRVSAPRYVEPEEYAHNVRVAHIQQARQAREVLLEALKRVKEAA